VPAESGNDPRWADWRIQGVSILQGRRHTRKIKRGAIKANHFELTIRNLTGNLSALELRLQNIKKEGVPNYFGPQRFGKAGQNIPRAAQWLSREKPDKVRLPRHLHSLYLSSARSFVFNHVLSRRVALGSWNHLLDGELAMLDGSRSVFECSLPDRDLVDRCDSFDIHKVAAARRSLRLMPGDLQWSLSDNTLGMGFSLPAGSYATSVVRELISDKP
jgi:tRNA pseudouridine13 synthase